MPARLPPLFLPGSINTGPWVAGYALDALCQRVAAERVVLPICSLGTPAAPLEALGPLVLPPLYREAGSDDPTLLEEMIAQIRRCFPFFAGTRAQREWRGRLDVVEVPASAAQPLPSRPPVLAFGVDTTVEQHGPHLPLATDTIQTYAVLQALASTVNGITLGPPLDYGHLTWGLPFGGSIDLTPPLLARYLRGFVHALIDRCAPGALYVADVHGSLVHRKTIQETLARSCRIPWAFRWLHDPLAEFSVQRDDMHAGGVETVLVQHIAPDLIDASWWPAREKELDARSMTGAEAVALSADLSRFIARVESTSPNGIIGKIMQASTLDAHDLFARMLAVAQNDARRLIAQPPP